MAGINTNIDTLDWLELDPAGFDDATREAFDQAVAEGRDWAFVESLRAKHEGSSEADVKRD